MEIESESFDRVLTASMWPAWLSCSPAGTKDSDVVLTETHKKIPLEFPISEKQQMEGRLSRWLISNRQIEFKEEAGLVNLVYPTPVKHASL